MCGAASFALCIGTRRRVIIIARVALGYPSYAQRTCETARPPPKLGQHTREILAECEYNEAEIAAFEEAGTI